MKMWMLLLGIVILVVTPITVVQVLRARACSSAGTPGCETSAAITTTAPPIPQIAQNRVSPTPYAFPTATPTSTVSPASTDTTADAEDSDEQTLSLQERKLSISNGNSITFPFASSITAGWLSSTDWSSFSSKSGGYSFDDGLTLGGSKVTNNLVTGLGGGQTINGGTAAGENLTINSTTNQSQGNIYLNPTGGSVGVGTTTPGSKLAVAGSFQAGSTGEFSIDSNGNITSIHDVDYSFPSSQGSVNTVLANNGSGVLSWVAASGGGITADSLDFSDLKDAMTLDANLTIAAGSNYSINVDSNTLFVDTANNRVGIGTASPSTTFEINGNAKITTNNTLTLTSDNSVGTISRLLTLKATDIHDRPWISHVDYDGRHVVSYGALNTNNDETVHKRWELKTAADINGATPSEMFTRLAIDYDADLAYVIFSHNQSVGIYNDYGQKATFLHRLSTDSTNTTDVVVGQWTTELSGSDNTLMTFDAKTIDAAKSATIRMFRETNTAGARRISILKGDGTTTETFGIDAANGNIDNVNNIYTTGFVGIGTSSPGTLLQVATTSAAITVGDNSNTATYITLAGSRTFTGYDGSFAVLQGGTSKGIKFNVNSSSFGAGTAMTVTSGGNVGIGVTAAGTSAAKVLAIGNGTAPSTSIVDGVQLYAEDVAASSELRVRDEAGNITTLSPHNFSLIPEGPSEGLAWSYYSEKNGQAVNVDMMRALRLVEDLTGEKLLYTTNLATGSEIAANVDRIFERVGSVVHFVKELVFEQPVTFLQKVRFNQILTFTNTDAAGQVTLLAGQQNVRVIFSAPTEFDPIVTVTPRGAAAKYFIKDDAKDGFTIEVAEPLSQDMQFNWVVVQREK